MGTFPTDETVPVKTLQVQRQKPQRQISCLTSANIMLLVVLVAVWDGLMGRVKFSLAKAETMRLYCPPVSQDSLFGLKVRFRGLELLKRLKVDLSNEVRLICRLMVIQLDQSC